MGESEDGPGCYVVLRKAVVTREPKFQGDASVLAKVDVGGLVEVLEVEDCAEDMRLRARIEQPAGWMSLLNTETGRRWAQRAALCPQGHRLAREGAAEAGGRCSTCGSDIAEGASLLRCQPCGYSLCHRCVAGCAQQKAWTFDAAAGCNVEVLGFTHEVLTPFRVLIRDVEVGSWADDHGVKAGDELLAANGVHMEKMPREEFANLFESLRPLSLTFLWDAREAVADSITPTTSDVLGLGAPKPQLLDGRPVRPPFWGVSRAQCRELLRQLRKDPSWKAEGTMQQLVTEYVVPLTAGSGLGYALWKNREAPKEVNVVVTHAWGENAERLLETVLRSTSRRDVLFIAALALYQAEDSAGPRIEEQLGGQPTEGPFQQALEHVAARGARAGCCWRRQGLLRALPPLLLGVAAALFWGPLAYWSCVPSPDFERCALRTHPDAGWSQRVEWTWQSEYAHGSAKMVFFLLYIAALGLAIQAAILHLAIQLCCAYGGRLIAVPCEEDKLSGRLWSIYFIHAAKKLKVPAFLANSLVSAGTCRASEARCATARDEECLRRLLEDSERGYGEADRAVSGLRSGRRWAVRLAALRWAALFTLVRSADLRLVANEPWRWDPAPPAPAMAVLGAAVGALLCAGGAYRLLWRPGGSLRGWAFYLSPALPLALGGGALLALALTQRLRPASFGQDFIVVDWLSDEGYRHSACSATSCQLLVAFVASLAQTLIIGGVNLTVFVVGTLCCPRFVKRHQCVVASLVAIFLVGAACAIFVLRPLLSEDGLPEPEFWHAAAVFHVTQLLSRCAVPLGALCTFAACWGWPSCHMPTKAVGKPAAEGCAAEQQLCVDGEEDGEASKTTMQPPGSPAKEEESRRLEV